MTLENTLKIHTKCSVRSLGNPAWDPLGFGSFVLLLPEDTWENSALEFHTIESRPTLESLEQIPLQRQQLKSETKLAGLSFI